MVPYGPALSEHCILLAGLRPTRKPKAEPLEAAERAVLMAGVRQWEAWLDACETSAPEGFISFKRTGAVAPENKQPFPACISLRLSSAHGKWQWRGMV